MTPPKHRVTFTIAQILHCYSDIVKSPRALHSLGSVLVHKGFPKLGIFVVIVTVAHAEMLG